ncbi:MAG: PDZ domain-containing protein [Planctomycetota bacterium]
MRTLAVVAMCAAVLMCGVMNTANAQSTDDLKKWAQDARERMNQEFDRQRQTIKEMEQRLNRLQDDLTRKLDEILGGNSTPSQPAQPAQPAQPQVAGGAYLGVAAGPIDDGMRTLLDIPAGQGVLVNQVVEGGPSAGSLKVYDVILSADGKNVATAEELRAAVSAHKPGESIKLEILRESARQTITVKLGAGRPTPNGNGGNTPSADPNDLRGFLDRAFNEGNVPDPTPEQGGGNPFGQGNPFGNGQNPLGGEGMQQLQERMQELFQNPERLQQLMEQFREMMGGRNNPNPNNPNGGGQNPLGGQLEDFLRGLEGNQGQGQPSTPNPTPAPAARPWVGMRVVNPNDAMQAAGAKGVQITQVTPNGPAALAGLQRGDLITGFAGHEVTDRDSLKAAIDTCKVGDKVKVVFTREGKENSVEMTIKSQD